jgi:hypothetical protein
MKEEIEFGEEPNDPIEPISAISAIYIESPPTPSEMAGSDQCPL